jgi:hypothetical protein
VDELPSWFKNFNRYHKGNEQEFWNSAWSGKPINVDRKTGEPSFVPNPFISVAGTIQPVILHQIGKEGRMHNGFLDRILFAIPDKLEKARWNDEPIDPDILNAWKSIVTKLLDIPFEVDGNGSPRAEILPFSLDAWTILKEWQTKNTDLVNKSEDDLLAGMYSKLEIYVIRLSLILENLKWACGESDKLNISAESVGGAIQLIEYFRNNGEKVNSIISNYSPLDKLTHQRKTFYEALPDEFTTAEGQEIAQFHEIPIRSYKRFIADKQLFKHVKRGIYLKQA